MDKLFDGDIIKIQGDDFGIMFGRLPESTVNKMLRDAAQIVENSTQVGYQLRIAPDGTKWAENPKWVQDIKGQDTPLTGPLTTKIHGGRMAGKYKLKSVNKVRMKNSLISRVSGSQAIVEYNDAAKSRARTNQNGGDSIMEFEPIKKKGKRRGKLRTWPVKVQKRPHLGIADAFYRLPSGTDPDIINKTILGHIEMYLEK